MDPVTSVHATPTAPVAATSDPANGSVSGAGEELDVWWGSYAGRAMVPSFVLCGLLTVVIAFAAWYWWDARYCAYTLGALLWGFQLVRCGYRTVFTSYRLTTRRLFRDRGFHGPAGPPVDLAAVTEVAVEQPTFWERLLDLGRIRVVSGSGPVPELVLEGVHRPGLVAEQIRQQVQRAKGKQSGGPSNDEFRMTTE